MAKRNKSAAIRAIIEAKPAASIKEIQAALAAKRMKVSPALIHQVRGKAKPSTNGHVSMDGLLAAKGLRCQDGKHRSGQVGAGFIREADGVSR